MRKHSHLILVDRNLRRRAAISHCLSDSNIHVEPFEDGSELITHWPHEGILLVHDDGETISELIEYMGASGDWLPLIGFAENPSTRDVVKAVTAGALDYVGWPFDEQSIAEIVSEVEGKAEAMGSLKLREAVARSRVERLTRREREVLAGVANGLSNRLIGEKLHISPRTVEIHRANMLTKMGANHTSEAIHIAIEASVVG